MNHQKQKPKFYKYSSANLIIKQHEKHGNLVLGDCHSATDKQLIKQYKIKHIISIGKQAVPPKDKRHNNVQYNSFDVHDNKDQNILEMLQEMSELIQKKTQQGSVLIHCYAGVSRSASFVIGYLMKKHSIEYEKAKDLVKQQRNCICPNEGFVMQLNKYWFKLQQNKQKLQKQAQ